MNAPRLPYSHPVAGPRRPDKTIADYLGIAIGPVLIMLMVGSLNFFLVEIGYRGSFTGQILWTLFWFTVAAVLVSRISIEQGSSYGGLYGLVLGAATGLRLCQFLGAPLSALAILAFIWWCAAKLTWDCTLIDDQTDASGEGLLQRTGLEAEPSPDDPIGGRPSHFLDRFARRLRRFRTGPRHRIAPSSAPASDPVPPPHAPGVWVIYFSLAALPVFGLGQWFIPATDEPARLRGFLLASVFVASALALLLSTSFLGLRRYLRQRMLVMPPVIARSWMMLGTVAIGAVLLGALLLPRPRGLATLAHLGLGLHERPQKASEHAWMPGEAADGPGRRIGRPAPSQRAAERPGPSEASRQPAAEPDSNAGTDTTRSKASGQDGPGSSGSHAAPSPPEASLPTPTPPPEALRWLSYALALVVVALLVHRFGPAWLAALRAVRARSKSPPGTAPSPAARRRAFPEFDNPFSSGRANRMSPVELASYTFAALEAWAADAGQPRRPDRTPVEFAQDLARSTPDLSDNVLDAVRVYVQAAYGGRPPGPDAADALRRLWDALRPA